MTTNHPLEFYRGFGYHNDSESPNVDPNSSSHSVPWETPSRLQTNCMTALAIASAVLRWIGL